MTAPAADPWGDVLAMTDEDRAAEAARVRAEFDRRAAEARRRVNARPGGIPEHQTADRIHTARPGAR